MAHFGEEDDRIHLLALGLGPGFILLPGHPAGGITRPIHARSESLARNLIEFPGKKVALEKERSKISMRR